MRKDGTCAYYLKLIRKKFKEISKEVQEFGVALRRVYDSCTTGSVERTKIHEMVCLIHLVRTEKIEYRFMNGITREQWPQYVFFVVLQKYPKFSIEVTASDVVTGSAMVRSGECKGVGNIDSADESAAPDLTGKIKVAMASMRW